MNITVVAVGKLKERFWADACAEYLKRLQPYAKTTVREVPDRDPKKCGGDDAVRRLEGEDLLAAVPHKARTVLLDIGGKELSSEQIAERIERWGVDGTSDVAFLIGGSSGVSAEVRAAADERLSFGKITLPHNLARVVLLEQLYRAHKIIKGEPYHK